MANARKSQGNAFGVFISPEGWRTLAGGNTPGNDTTMPHPEGVPESTVGYPIRPIRRICINPHCHPEYELLIKVENDLGSSLSRSSHRPIIRPENKGIKPKSNRHRPKKFIFGHYAWSLSPGDGRLRSPETHSFSATLRDPKLLLVILCYPICPPRFFMHCLQNLIPAHNGGRAQPLKLYPTQPHATLGNPTKHPPPPHFSRRRQYGGRHAVASPKAFTGAPE